jgi:pyruvate/2-oxoglutarate dehydrogenase complex dihydrolipoamide acyltransferase (E2) component
MNKLLEEIKTPQDSVNDDSVVIVKIHVKNGDKILQDQILAEIETSKADIEIHSTEAGFVKCLCEENKDVLIGETLFEIYSEKLEINELTKAIETETPTKVISKAGVVNPASKEKEEILKEFNTKYSKGAEQLILKNKLDKNKFKNIQFVSINEVNDFLEPSKSKLPTKEENPNTNAVELITVEEDLILIEENIGKKKLNEIKYLSNVNSTGLVSRLTMFINSNLNQIIESQNFISSTPLPLVTYEVSRLLLKYSNMNSFFYLGKRVTHKDINIGIAYDNGINGLKVASINNTDSMDLNSIEEAISDLSIKYNENKLSLKEITSASLTITDLFASGVCNFHPLVNINNSVILGICGMKNGGFNLEVSFDHRISNGLEVSKFLSDLKYRLEARYGIVKNETILNSTGCIKCLRDLDDDMYGNVKFIKTINTKNEQVICSMCLSGW